MPLRRCALGQHLALALLARLAFPSLGGGPSPDARRRRGRAADRGGAVLRRPLGATTLAEERCAEDTRQRCRVFNCPSKLGPTVCSAKYECECRPGFCLDFGGVCTKQADIPTCQKDTGGTCRFHLLGCGVWRGNTTCDAGRCRCAGSLCAVATGECVKGGESEDMCPRNTGATCPVVGMCMTSLHGEGVQCRGGFCICQDGYCSLGGRCIEQQSYVVLHSIYAFFATYWKVIVGIVGFGFLFWCVFIPVVGSVWCFSRGFSWFRHRYCCFLDCKREGGTKLGKASEALREPLIEVGAL